MRRILVALIVAVALAGCSSSEPTGTAPSQAVDDASSFPITVDGALGSAVVESEPTRVVALSWTDADILLSLGVTPVATARATAESGFQPWTEAAIAGKDAPAFLQGANADLSVEDVLSYEPDLIVGTKAFGLDTRYDQLSALAPVVHYASTPSAETWQEATRTIAGALGRDDDGERVIEETESTIAGVAEANPGFAGRTFTFFVGPADGSVYVVNSIDDAGAQFLDALGMRPTDHATTLPTSSIPGRAEITYEDLSNNDADLVIATGPPAALDEFRALPGVSALSAVQRGDYVPLAPTEAQSIAFPSPLGLAWAVETIVPTF
ncbi:MULTISPECIES: ABC transporter substrate-binding protein [Nocardiaceae]|uniref:Iron complex transport system substrate-binding protein n=1 Tax=Rhodococcoides corynebacterioides TaxID=53972 RepID=A0ABS2KNH5_9NOCA|nr:MULTISPECIES: ABC transporter substrate-binding protein [Rhodococcus]MBM7413514.1 iron complex transport system substrate-binding protein [Rhodococcus corynebacterioides]MBP1115977.1 iron complex transport system substrate-binding protein [Rhodococcus sp. PvP016]